MTKKDYIAIAAIIKSVGARITELDERAYQAADDMRIQIARDCADMPARDNSRFDRARFLAACGVAS